MKKKSKPIDLNEIFPPCNQITVETLEVQRKCHPYKGGGGDENWPPVQIDFPEDDRWKILKQKVMRLDENNLSLSVGDRFGWVSASAKNPDYLRLGLFSAAFYDKGGDHCIVFRKYVSSIPGAHEDCEYWAMKAINTKIPYWEVSSENFSTWTDEGICFLVKSKLERMYQMEVDNVL